MNAWPHCGRQRRPPFEKPGVNFSGQPESTTLADKVSYARFLRRSTAHVARAAEEAQAQVPRCRHRRSVSHPVARMVLKKVEPDCRKKERASQLGDDRRIVPHLSAGDRVSCFLPIHSPPSATSSPSISNLKPPWQFSARCSPRCCTARRQKFRTRPRARKGSRDGSRRNPSAAG